MNKLKLKKTMFILVRFISFMLCMFAVYVGCYSVISLTIFKQYIFPINYIGILFLTASIVAAILTALMYFNKLTFIIKFYCSSCFSLCNCYDFDLFYWILY